MRPFLILAWIFLQLQLPALGGAPSLPPTSDICWVALQRAVLRPGDVTVAVLRCAAAPLRIRASISGHSVPFFEIASPDSGRIDERVALLGIDLESRPGRKEVVWDAALVDGSTASGTASIAIEKERFATQRLQLPKGYVDLDPETLARVRREQRRVNDLLSLESPERLWRGAFVMPVLHGRGSGFGSRRVLNGRPGSPHSGLDIAVPVGTPVLASNAGTVVLADSLVFAGRTVVVDHGLGLFTSYNHLSQISVVTGDKVEKGQTIARSGASGRVTGPHLHWSVRLSGARVDPRALLEATGMDALDVPAPDSTSKR